MFKISIILSFLLVSGCTTFNRSDIPPGQRVPGPGFSFDAPRNEHHWFASEYGTSNRIKLVQLNQEDTYTVLVSLNRGPGRGMYPSAEAHLRVFQKHKELELHPPGYFLLDHQEWIDEQYGHLCIRYSAIAKDWRGRSREGAAVVDMQGLTCEHKTIPNVLISFELSHRYDENTERKKLDDIAHQLFKSIEFNSLD